jgi:hypothetical protein
LSAASGSKAWVQSASSNRGGRAYAAFAADIDKGTQTVSAFAEAVRRHEVIAAIEGSATSGERLTSVAHGAEQTP